MLRGGEGGVRERREGGKGRGKKKRGGGGERERASELRGNPGNAHALVWRAALGRGSRRRDGLRSSGKRTGSGSPRGALSPSGCACPPGAPRSRRSPGREDAVRVERSGAPAPLRDSGSHPRISDPLRGVPSRRPGAGPASWGGGGTGRDPDSASPSLGWGQGWPVRREGAGGRGKG